MSRNCILLVAACVLVGLTAVPSALATSPYDLPYGIQWSFMNGNDRADLSWSGNIAGSPDGTIWIQTSGTGKTSSSAAALTWGNPGGSYNGHYASGYAQISPNGVILQGQDHPALPISNYNQGYPAGVSMKGTTAYICIYPGRDTTWDTVPGDVGASGNPFSWSVDPVATPQGAPYTGTLGAMVSHNLVSKGGRTHDMAVDSSGNQYFVGANQSGDKFTAGDFDTLATQYRPWVGKVAADGVTISGPAYQPSGDFKRDYFGDVAVNEATGRVYATGYSYQTQADQGSLGTYWDPDGASGPLAPYNPANTNGIGTAVVYNSDWSIAHSIVWESDVGGEGIYDCVPTGDGGVIMIGGTSGDMPGHAGTNPGGTDTYVAKYDASGALVWDYQSGAAGNDSGGDVRIDADGNIYVGGNETNAVNATNDPYVMKLQSDGTFVWKAAIDNNGTVENCQDVATISKEKVYVIGRANPYTDNTNTVPIGTPWVPVNDSPHSSPYVPRGKNEILVTKMSPGDYDTDGDVDWDDVALCAAGTQPATGGLDTYDFDEDGDSDFRDTKYMIEKVMDRLVGDTNLNNKVDAWQPDGTGDAQVLSSNLGTTTGMVWADGDFNFDADVDVWQADGTGDAQLLSENMGVSLDVGHDVGTGEAEALYNPGNGELFFDVGADVAVVGIGSAVMYPGNADDFFTAAPAQNLPDSLAFFNPTGLPVGEDSVGLVLPAGLAQGDMIFSYTPVGGDTTEVPVFMIPEPSTITMTLLALGFIGILWRRRRA